MNNAQRIGALLFALFSLSTAAAEPTIKTDGPALQEARELAPDVSPTFKSMLLQIRAIEHGTSAYAHFQAWMSCPAVMIINAAALGLIIFHAVTWFALVPRVFVKHMGGTSIPDLFAAVPNYGAWFVASLIVALFALRLI